MKLTNDKSAMPPQSRWFIPNVHSSSNVLYSSMFSKSFPPGPLPPFPSSPLPPPHLPPQPPSKPHFPPLPPKHSPPFVGDYQGAVCSGFQLNKFPPLQNDGYQN